MSLFVRYGEKRLDTTTEKGENLMVIACAPQSCFLSPINIHMGSSVRLTGLGTVAGEKCKFLARCVDFQKVLRPIMAQEEDDLPNCRPLATSSPLRSSFRSLRNSRGRLVASLHAGMFVHFRECSNENGRLSCIRLFIPFLYFFLFV